MDIGGKPDNVQARYVLLSQSDAVIATDMRGAVSWGHGHMSSFEKGTEPEKNGLVFP